MFPMILIMSIPSFFSVMFCMPISSFTYTPSFDFSTLVCVFPCLDENFWGVYAYAAIYVFGNMHA